MTWRIELCICILLITASGFFVGALMTEQDLSHSVAGAQGNIAGVTAKTALALFGDGKTSNGIIGNLTTASKRLDTLAQVTNDLVNQTRDIVRDEHKQFGVQSAATMEVISAGQKSVDQLTADAAQLGSLVTDVRTTTLPTLNRSIDSLTQFTTSIQKPTDDMLAQGNAAMAAATTTIQSMNALVNSPEITATLKSLAASGVNVQTGTQNLSDAAGFIRADLSPKHLPLWQTLVESIIPYGLGAAIRIWSPTTVQGSVSIGNTPTVIAKPAP